MIKKIIPYFVCVIFTAVISIWAYQSKFIFSDPRSVDGFPRGMLMSQAQVQGVNAMPQVMLQAPPPTNANLPMTVAMVSKTQLPSNPNATMIIRNANLTLQVAQISSSLQKITQFANQSGGYVVNSSVSQDNDQGNVADISIRIPSEGFNDAIAQLKALSTHVVSEQVTGNDITAQYIDLKSQLKNLMATKDQLNTIMAQAKNTQDVLAVYTQLSDTQGQIDRIQGQLKYFQQSVSLSLMSIHLTENPVIKQFTLPPWLMSEIIKTSYDNLLINLQKFSYTVVYFMIAILPLILLWGLLGWIVFYLGKKSINELNKRNLF